MPGWWLKQQTVIVSSGGWRPEIKVPARLTAGEASLPGPSPCVLPQPFLCVWATLGSFLLPKYVLVLLDQGSTLCNSPNLNLPP
jgi:hypothetical protein